MNRIFLVLLVIPSLSAFSRDVFISLQWKNQSFEYTYPQLLNNLIQPGGTVFEYPVKKTGYYQKSYNFLWLFNYTKEYSGTYEYKLSLQKNDNDNYILFGYKSLSEQVDKETVTNNYEKISIPLKFNKNPFCIEEENKKPSWKLCVSYG